MTQTDNYPEQSDSASIATSISVPSVLDDGEINPEILQQPQSKTSTSGTKVEKVFSHGDRLYIGRKQVDKNEMLKVLGFVVGQPNPAPPPPPARRKFANPVPLGYSCFSLTLLVYSLVLAEARGVQPLNIIVGLAFFYGGLTMLCAGMWAMACELTSEAFSLASFAAFWVGLGSTYTPGFGILLAYEEEAQEFNALGFLYLSWFFVAVISLIVRLKSTVVEIAFYFLLTLQFLLLTIFYFDDVIGCKKAAGVIGVIAAVVGFLQAFTHLSTSDNTWFPLRSFPVPYSDKTKLKM